MLKVVLLRPKNGPRIPTISHAWDDEVASAAREAGRGDRRFARVLAFLDEDLQQVRSFLESDEAAGGDEAAAEGDGAPAEGDGDA